MLQGSPGIADLKPSKIDISFLERQLFDFNCSKVENYSYESLIIKVISKADSIIAGIHAEIGGGWLYIVSLWVDEKYRGMGFGKKLLDLAEKQVLRKNAMEFAYIHIVFKVRSSIKSLDIVFWGHWKIFVVNTPNS